MAGTLRLPLYGPLGQADPALASTSAGMFLDSLLYSGLVKFGPDLHVIPDLAVSMPTISADGRSYTFTVRQDARFADGTRCSAEDVAFSLARAVRLHGPLAWQYLGNIVGAAAVWNGSHSSLAGVRVLGRLTIRIRLRHPDADFLQKLAFPVAWVVEQGGARRDHSQSGLNTPPGTGPFAVSGRRRDGTLLLTPRRHSYGGQVQVRSLQLLPVASQAAALDLYRQGTLDAAAIPGDRYASLARSAAFHTSPGLDAYYVLPGRAGTFSPAGTLDRNALLRATPALSPLLSIVPPVVPDYVPSTSSTDPVVPLSPVRIVAPPLDTAAQLLRRALYRQWGRSPGGQRGAVTVRLVHVSHALPDPGLWLRTVLPETRSQWFRHLLSRAATLTNDPVTRMAAYSRCETWALQQGLVIPLAEGSVSYLIKPTVQNLQVTPVGLMPANNSWATVSVS